ncbi:two-component system sensor histidine kinase NtrB [Caldimonas brevitalea]|uniref:histidine kinase n=1 Tax=Caldimonas brevitalea TaxID=413882 RepID=A0A0G3BE85_9BURK|nr:ATP-binding protein [Caldimonas brevitalea]AKJ27739.1 histidine kinase [Caldimonas brevitalea]
MSRRPTKARKTDNRRTAHPSEGNAQAAESWFAALGVAPDTGFGDDRGEGKESRYTGWTPPSGSDSRFLSRQARRLLGATLPSFQRIYRTFLGARAAVGLLLLATQFASLLSSNSGRAVWPVAIYIGYAVAAFATWWLARSRPEVDETLPSNRLLRRQWMASIGADLIVFGTLHLLTSNANINFVPLLVLPVLMAGVLTPRLSALAVAAAVTLLLLGEAWLNALHGGQVTVLMTQAGLVGTGFFVVTILAGELAGRLAREELAARGSMELARQQAQLNRLVIEEMQDGVLVVDRRGRVRAANPAARRLIADEGLVRPAPFHLHSHPVWAPLAQAAQRAFVEAKWPAAGRELTLQFASGQNRALRVRMRFTKRRQPDHSEELCVILLEDLRDVQARMRQEKLAAMGRISAGIAHEIRNPLSAIAQANGLMSEDATTPAQRQLTQMVADNVERLKRIIDDVMEVAPGGPPTQADVVDITELVGATCAEWARTARLALDERSALRLMLPSQPLGAAFDPEHLRRVLVNLLDNGYRHASGTPGCVEVRLTAESQILTLSVASDGAPIPPDVERYLFEPFFSTRSRGTGLGLYICKELCERYGATIDYRLRGTQHVARNEFFVVMRLEPLRAAEAPLASLNLAR